MEQKQKFLPTGKLAAGIKYTRDGIKNRYICCGRY